MQPRGFIALTSAILIASILLVIAASGSLGGFFSRSVALDAEYKARSSALADACVATVLLRLADDPIYAGSEVVPVGDDSCALLSSEGFDPRTFTIQAIYNHAYTDLQVTVDPQTLRILSVYEVPRL